MFNLECRRAPLAAALAGGLFLCTSAWAANPSSGTVSSSSTQANWTGGPLTPTAASTCGGPNNPACDNYKLTIVPPAFAFKVDITLTLQPTDDYDLEVYANPQVPDYLREANFRMTASAMAAS